MTENPISMEEYFNPGFKTKPAVHIGSQTMRFFHGDPKEQAYEARHLAAASGSDLTVVRSLDPDYLKYWNSLMGQAQILTLPGVDNGEFLTRIVLDSPRAMNWITDNTASGSRLMVFLPTALEQELADKLGISLHGSPEISDLYGTKSGIRVLADEAGLQMSPGFICSTQSQVKEAIAYLERNFDSVAVKHDLSTGGGWSKRIYTSETGNLAKDLNEIAGGEYTEGKDILVVEGWLKSKASLCAHIEILEGQEPIVCAGWGQIIDTDGISYMGAGPLMISHKALESFNREVHKLATALKQKGAVGSYAPDFIVVADDEKNFEPDASILLELNARVPATAFPLEIVKQVKGEIGTGFCAQHIKLQDTVPFSVIAATLQDSGLLITGKDSKAQGVVPYNVGLLPWNVFDIVAMSDSWEQTREIVQRVNTMFGNHAGEFSS